MTFEQLQESKQKLLNILSSSETIALGYHADADGMTAAKILIETIFEMGFSAQDLFLYPTNAPQRTLEFYQEQEVTKLKPDTLIYLDLCLEHHDTALKFKPFIKNIVSIDHHYIDPTHTQGYDLIINSTTHQELTKPQVHTASKMMNSLFYNTKNDWLEIIGLEGDVAFSSLPGTLSSRASEILNILGLSARPDEDPAEQQDRRNALLKCLLDSSGLESFLNKLDTHPTLSQIYASLVSDINNNRELLKKEAPVHLYKKNKILIHHNIAQSGFNIIGLVLKAHFPYLEPNQTILLWQENSLQTCDIYLYTSHPLVDCFKISTSYHGGGHTNRAGCTIPQKDLETTLDQMVKTIKEMIDQAERR